MNIDKVKSLCNMSIEELKHIDKEKLNNLYGQISEVRDDTQEQKLYELLYEECDFNLIEDLEETITALDDLLSRIELAIILLETENYNK